MEEEISYDFIYATGLEEDRVYFYSNLILNTQYIYGDLLYIDTIIDNITIHAEENDVVFLVNAHNDECIKTYQGKVVIENADRYRVESIIKELNPDGLSESLFEDTFTFSGDLIERHTKDVYNNEFYKDVEFYNKEELIHLFSLYTEHKMYESFLSEILEDKDTLLLRNEEDLTDSFEEGPKRMLN